MVKERINVLQMSILMQIFIQNATARHQLLLISNQKPRMLQFISQLIAKQAVMEQDQYRETEPQKAIYTKTTLKKKEQLIDLVLRQNFTIYKASKILKISNSTAKSVIMNFQKYGLILNRNTTIQYEKVKTKKKGTKVDSPTVKIEEKTGDFQFNSFSIEDADRMRILGNMGLTSSNQYITVNMPFYNYPLG